MSPKSGNKNKSSSGSPMSGVDSDAQEMRRIARRRPHEQPVASQEDETGYFLGEDDFGIFNSGFQFDGTPIPSPRPAVESQQGSPSHVGTPQGESHIPTFGPGGYRSQQGSPSHVGTPQGAPQQASSRYLTPLQNTGRERTQSPRAGSSTQPVASPGAQAIGYGYYNPSSPSQYNPYAPYPGFMASEEPGTPDYTLMPDQQDPWAGSSAQGATRGGASQYRESPPPATLAPSGASGPGSSTGPSSAPARQGDRNKCPAGIDPSKWDEKDRNWDWDNKTPDRNYKQQISIIARIRKITINDVRNLHPEEKLADMNALRAEGVFPAKKSSQYGRKRPESTSRPSQASGDRGRQSQRSSGVGPPTQRGDPAGAEDVQYTHAPYQGGNNLPLPSPPSYQNMADRSRSGTGSSPRSAGAFTTPNTAQLPAPPALGTWNGKPWRNIRPEGIPVSDWTENDITFNWDDKSGGHIQNHQTSLIAREKKMSQRQVGKMPERGKQAALESLRNRGCAPPTVQRKAPTTEDGEFDWKNADSKQKSTKITSIVCQKEGIKNAEYRTWGDARKAAAIEKVRAGGFIPQLTVVKGWRTVTAPQPTAGPIQPSQPSGSNLSSRRFGGGAERSRSSSHDSLYADPSPPRAANTIPGITRSGDGGRSASPRAPSRAPDKESKKAAEKAKKDAEKVRKDAEKVRKEKEKANEKKRLRDEKELEKSRKRGGPSKTTSPKPKPPGPSAGKRRK